MSRLLEDFGHELPAAASPPKVPRGPRTFRTVPRSGPFGRDRGWSAASAPVTRFRMTSDQAPVLWPWIATPGLPPTGAQMGIDHLSGGAFYADPVGWVLDESIPVTNPNIMAMGKPGQGKSATTKAFCLRMMGFGYRTLVLGDPKDEYEALCRALGVEPFAIGHGLPARINPLAIGPLGHNWERLSAAEAQGRATYDKRLEAFSRRHEMAAYTWTQRVINRMAKLNALTGRDRMKDAFRALGFPLR